MNKIGIIEAWKYMYDRDIDIKNGEDITYTSRPRSDSFARVEGIDFGVGSHSANSTRIRAIDQL